MKQLRQFYIDGLRTTSLARVLLMSIVTLAFGCTANQEEQEITDITDFVVVPGEESEGDLDGGEVSGDISTCSIAPRIGTLVIARIVSKNWVSVSREVGCEPEWQYAHLGYTEIEIEVLEQLAGSKLPVETMTTLVMPPFNETTESVEPGDIRMPIISPQLEGDYFMTWTGLEILPANGTTPASNPSTGRNYTFPTNVADLKAELASFMAQNDPLPTNCPNTNAVTPRLDEDDLRHEFFYEYRGERTYSCEFDSNDAGYRPPDGYVGYPDAGE